MEAKVSKPGEAGRELSCCGDALEQVPTRVHGCGAPGTKSWGGSRGHDGLKHQQIFFSCQNKEDFFDKREQTEGLLSSAVSYCSWKSMMVLQL